MDRSIATVHPELLSEWSERNGSLTPEQISYGSNKKVWWHGKCGHEWPSSPKARHAGSGCPICSKNLVQPGLNDFATSNPELVKQWSDKNASAPNQYAPRSSQKVWWHCEKNHEWQARIVDRVNGSQCPYCTVVKLLPGYNDLKTRYPEIAAEWSKQNEKTPEFYSPKSRENAWWKCPDCEYEYKAVIDARVKGLCCPVCSEYHIVSGFNDLLTTDSELCKEWDYEKNAHLSRPLFPDKLSRNSKYYAWWKGKCGHEWKARICDRALKREGCLVCYNAFNDVLPELAVVYYAKMKQLELVLDDTELIGVAIDAYFPELGLIIDFDRGCSDTNPQLKSVKTHIAKRHKLKYRIILWKDEFEPYNLLNAIRKLLADENIIISTDVAGDCSALYKKYQQWNYADLT